MQKVAILSDFPLSAVPGIPLRSQEGHFATWLPPLANAFQEEKDFEFHWLVLDPSIQQPKQFRAWNQVFHVLPTWKHGRAATLFWADRRRIQKKLREIAPHLVHGWGNENIWGLATLLSGRKHIFSIQGLLGLYGKLGCQGLRDRLMASIEAIVLRKAMLLTAESPWAIEEVKKLTKRADVRLVEYGVPHEFFDAEYLPDTKSPYALMIGTTDFRKGIDFAVQLFCRPELAGIRLKVVGGISPFGEFWKKASSGNIEWLGRKQKIEIIRLMAGATCLVLPTRGDTGPTVAKEARVIGLPIVASPHGGHVQYIENGYNGFVCSLNSPETWISALRQIFSDPAKAKTIGSGHQVKHRLLLRPDRTAEAFARLYREVLCQGVNL